MFQGRQRLGFCLGPDLVPNLLHPQRFGRSGKSGPSSMGSFVIQIATRSIRRNFIPICRGMATNPELSVARGPRDVDVPIGPTIRRGRRIELAEIGTDYRNWKSKCSFRVHHSKYKISLRGHPKKFILMRMVSVPVVFALGNATSTWHKTMPISLASLR
jgi:hypothetical protein